MDEEKWYYQVLMHEGQDMYVHLEGTYESKDRAQQEADSLNVSERADTRADLPPRHVYYVRAITEEQLLEKKTEKRQRRYSEVRKSLKKQHHAVLKPLTEEMAAAMLRSIETCEKNDDDTFYRGGWTDGYHAYARGIGYIACSAFYDDDGHIDLVVTLECCKVSTAVGHFCNERILKSWLQNMHGAACSFENRIIDTLYKLDRLCLWGESTCLYDED